MQSEAELKAQKARSGMADDEHQRLVAAVTKAVRAHGFRTDAAVHAVVGGILGEGLARLESDGTVSWTGEHGWDLPSALPGYMRTPEVRLIRERDRELAGEVAPDTKDAKAALAVSLAAALGAGPAPTMTRASLGTALNDLL